MVNSFELPLVAMLRHRLLLHKYLLPPLPQISESNHPPELGQTTFHRFPPVSALPGLATRAPRQLLQQVARIRCLWNRLPRAAVRVPAARPMDLRAARGRPTPPRPRPNPRSCALPGKTRRPVHIHSVTRWHRSLASLRVQPFKRNHIGRHGIYSSLSLKERLGDALLCKPPNFSALWRIPFQHATDVVVKQHQLPNVTRCGYRQQGLPYFCSLECSHLCGSLRCHEWHSLLPEIRHLLTAGSDKMLSSSLPVRRLERIFRHFRWVYD